MTKLADEKNLNEEAEAEETKENAEAENVTEDTKETIAGEETCESGDKKEDKKKKKDKESKKTDALKEKIEELEDRTKRQMAEFDNFRKRTEREKATMFDMGARSVIEKMLPVVDNFERGLASMPEENQTDPIYEGMNLIYKQLMGELDKLGVKPIEALGQEFNPDLHNAVMQVESEEFEEGIVAQELQKGYMYRDSVVRHSMVAVAQ